MINKLKVLAIIPARGGSKRIPNKNIKPLCGKPLLVYAIEQGKASKYIDRVIVSTDSEEIKAMGLKYGAEVPFMRPVEISGDASTDLELFTHAVNWFKEKENYVPDLIVQLRPTSPLRTTEQIDQAIEMLIKNSEADSVRTVARPDQHPYKMYEISDKGFLKPLFVVPGNSESMNISEQYLPKVFKHVGYIDVVWTKTIMEKKKMAGDNILPFFLEKAVGGINKPEDWPYYEYLICGQK